MNSVVKMKLIYLNYFIFSFAIAFVYTARAVRSTEYELGFLMSLLASIDVCTYTTYNNNNKLNDYKVYDL
jgi:hypothetical protein